MTMARAHLVDPTVTRWYHCITRCVRRAFLLGDPEHGRKDWIDKRLKELAEIFAVSVAAFSVMDNHLHVLVHLHPSSRDRWRYHGR
ncbi:transposase [Singulisphaera rosea]